jgi:nicotinamidase-related amidase
MRVEPESTMLLIVDMQNDFCKPDGALYSEQSQSIIPYIKKVLDWARESKMMIAYSQDWHEPDDPHFDYWPPHCIQGTWGAEIVDELSPLENELVFKKGAYSVFLDTDIEHHLRECSIKTLIICGTLVNICVLHTTADALQRYYNTVVPKECVASLNEYEMEYALYHIGKVLKGTLCSVDELVF